MIPITIIPQDKQRHIAQKLKALEEAHHIYIIIAIESGSRAWGFSSLDSDYDVRFIYTRHCHDYLSIMQPRDVLETDILYDSVLGVPIDLNGWDIRKALQLALKSNPVLIEWLQSPIVYFANNALVTDLMKFVQKTADLEYIKLHYYKLMNNIWQKIKQNDAEVTIKQYCYALRPALSIKWITTFNTLPPMDVSALYKGLANYITFGTELSELITLKVTAKEHDVIPRTSTIDDFIISMVQQPLDIVQKPINEKYRIEADQLFRKTLGIIE